MFLKLNKDLAYIFNIKLIAKSDIIVNFLFITIIKFNDYRFQYFKLIYKI